MNSLEATDLKTFSDWFRTNSPNNVFFLEVLIATAVGKKATKPVSKAVVEYIRERGPAKFQYDPYDELLELNSESRRKAQDISRIANVQALSL